MSCRPDFVMHYKSCNVNTAITESCMILEIMTTNHGEWDMFYSQLQSHAILANQQVGHGGLMSFQEA